VVNIPFFDRLKNPLWRAAKGSGTAEDPSVMISEVRTDPTDPLDVRAANLPLPTGASTSALQTLGNASLESLNNKTPSLGQAPAAESIPVVLPAEQITTLQYSGGRTYLSKQIFSITTSAILGVNPPLEIPDQAVSARVTAFSSSALDLWVGRFYRDGTNPTETQGIPVGNTDERNFSDLEGLSAWRFRKLDTVPSVTVIVEYWGL
jgi:hypothetical protein